jgi:hypothetical protein
VSSKPAQFLKSFSSKLSCLKLLWLWLLLVLVLSAQQIAIFWRSSSRQHQPLKKQNNYLQPCRTMSQCATGANKMYATIDDAMWACGYFLEVVVEAISAAR